MIKLPKTWPIYCHYKGGRYVVIGESQHTETLERLVLYEDCDHDHSPNHTWARPYDMFHDHVEVDGKKVRRFTLEDYMDKWEPR